jgi:hypothetical protein
MNPELRRNIWLQFSVLRLMLAPIAIGALLAATWLASDASLSAVAGVAEAIYYLLVLLWGSRRAADLVAEEIAGGTWDGQRMSALGAWQMTWGKLVGGTSYVWYCAGLAFAARLAAQLAGGEMPWHAGEGIQLLRMLTAGVLAQSVALLMSLAMLRRQSVRRGLGVSLSQVVGVLAGLAASGRVGTSVFSIVTPQIDWYGRVWDGAGFTLASLGLFLAWSIFGAYRLMRVELKFRGGPWAWLAFALFLLVYGEGFLYSLVEATGGALGAWLGLPFVLLVVLTYLALFLEPKDVMRYRWLGAALAGGDPGRAWALLPQFLPTFILALAVGIVFLFARGQGPLGWGVLLGPFVSEKMLSAAPGLSALPLAITLYLLRDALVVLYFNFGPHRQRGDASALIVLGIVYLPLMGIVTSLELTELAPILAPYPRAGALANLVAPLVESVAMAALVLGRLARAGRFAPAAA